MRGTRCTQLLQVVCHAFVQATCPLADCCKNLQQAVAGTGFSNVENGGVIATARAAQQMPQQVLQVQVKQQRPEPDTPLAA